MSTIQENPVTPNVEIRCDMREDCTATVTHVDDHGFVYCKAHGIRRRSSGMRCRALKPRELRTLQAGGQISYW